MDDGAERRVVVTGGPGAGKTALIDDLARRGLATSPEAGRAFIRAQRATGGAGLPWADRALFARLMATFDQQAYEAALRTGGLVIFDRGLPDVIGYLRLSELPIPADLDLAARQRRYRREVFIAPPWRDIFENDDERRQDFGEAIGTYEARTTVYRDYGYHLHVLPFASVATRATLVMDRICAS